MTPKELLALIIVAIAVVTGFVFLSIEGEKQRCTTLSQKLGAETKYYGASCYIKNPTGWHKI